MRSGRKRRKVRSFFLVSKAGMFAISVCVDEGPLNYDDRVSVVSFSYRSNPRVLEQHRHKVVSSLRDSPIHVGLCLVVALVTRSYLCKSLLKTAQKNIYSSCREKG